MFEGAVWYDFYLALLTSATLIVGYWWKGGGRWKIFIFWRAGFGRSNICRETVSWQKGVSLCEGTWSYDFTGNSWCLIKVTKAVEWSVCCSCRKSDSDFCVPFGNETQKCLCSTLQWVLCGWANVLDLFGPSWIPWSKCAHLYEKVFKASGWLPSWLECGIWKTWSCMQVLYARDVLSNWSEWTGELFTPWSLLIGCFFFGGGGRGAVRPLLLARIFNCGLAWFFLFFGSKCSFPCSCLHESRCPTSLLCVKINQSSSLVSDVNSVFMYNCCQD